MDSNTKVYLDYSATTPVDPRVLEAMLPYFQSEFGNPSSTHQWGQRAETAVEQSRDKLAEILGCNPAEIVFTGGGSESDNLALRGTVLARRERDGANHILITPVEHLAVSATARQLAEQHDFEVEYLPIDAGGRVDPVDLETALRPDTALVSVIYGNNEIGTVNSIEALGEICQKNKVPFHSDALQAALYLDLDVNNLAVDLLSLGAHKFYGPKGTGLLYIRDGTPIQPTQTGGAQEFGLRGGTINVPLIAGMTAALDLGRRELPEISSKIQNKRDRIISTALEEIPDTQLTGDPHTRLPHHASFAFKDVDGNLLLNLLDAAGFACSSGSACKTGNPAPSDVLLALGLPPAWALGSLRVTLGRWTTDEDVEAFCLALPKAVEQARTLGAI